MPAKASSTNVSNTTQKESSQAQSQTTKPTTSTKSTTNVVNNQQIQQSIQTSNKRKSRMDQLNNAVDVVISNALGDVKSNVMLECFPLIAKEKSKLLTDIHSKILNNLSNALKNEFEVICKEKNLPETLGRLDETLGSLNDIEVQHLSDSNASLSTITPKQQMMAKRIAMKKQQIEKMNIILSELEKDKKEAQEQIKEKQTKRKTLENSIMTIHSAFEKANDIVSEIDQEPLGQWVSGKEEELNG